MPPKKGAPSKKTVQKHQDKVIQDRTFGLKNKNKSAKVQKYVQAVTKQVVDGNSKKASKVRSSQPQPARATTRARGADECFVLVRLASGRVRQGQGTRARHHRDRFSCS